MRSSLRILIAAVTRDKGRVSNLANNNAERFVSDLGTPLVEGDATLIMSADAGG